MTGATLHQFRGGWSHIDYTLNLSLSKTCIPEISQV